jgi:hypothetical protein
MQNKLTKVFLAIMLISLYGCDSCYSSRQEAWDACNSKYNGKCSYLGPKYKVCPNADE